MSQASGDSIRENDGQGPTLTAPISASDRFEIIDIVRGFALFGVLLANIVWTTQWFAFPESDAADGADESSIGAMLVSALADHKFYTLFSMLFGLGFAIQLSRGASIPRYLRRLSVLFLIGAAHACLLWFGDILHMYALLGCALIVFHRRSDRTVLTWTIVIAACSVLVPFVRVGLEAAGLSLPESPVILMSGEERFALLKSGDWADVIAVNWNHLANYYTSITFLPGGVTNWYLSVFWKLLLGFYIGRKMLLQRAQEHRVLFRRVLPWAWGIGLVVNVAFAAGVLMSLLLYPVFEFGFFALSMAYLCTLVLLHQREGTRRVVGVLAPIGRMALTNYLMYSVVFVVLFYAAGFDLLGEVGVNGCIALSVAIYIAQIIVSTLWLRFFRFGPMEWVWRCLTYGKLQPLRRARG